MASQKCLYGCIWLLWSLAAMTSLAYATMSFLVLEGIYEWMYHAGVGRVVNLSGRIAGVTGSCAILVIVIAVYLIYSFYVLVSSAFQKKDVVIGTYQFGCMLGMTFCLAFITLQTALVVGSSQYLVAGNGAVGFQPKGLESYLNDDTLFNATTIMGYVTSFLFFMLAIFLASYQCAVGCGCCLDEPPAGKPGKGAGKPTPTPRPSKTPSKTPSPAVSDKGKAKV